MEVAKEVLKRLFCRKVYTLSEVSAHCHMGDCWMVIGNNVYDVTSFLDKHPGGMDVMLEQAGRDATVAFNGAGHYPNTLDLLEPFCIGALAQHERISAIGSFHQTKWGTKALLAE